MRLLAANLRHRAHGGPLDGGLVGGEHFNQPFRNGAGARPDSAQGVGGINASTWIVQQRDDRRGRAGGDRPQKGNCLERGNPRGFISVAEQGGQLVYENGRAGTGPARGLGGVSPHGGVGIGQTFVQDFNGILVVFVDAKEG